METLAADDSSGANPSSVKSDDSSPRHEGGRGSPPPNCAICLGTCRNKSFTDSCLHQFCFKCLLTWSKVKAECPLCKQVFKSIIHNVRSNHQYDEYTVEQRHEETMQSIDIDNITNATRRFRYRTTLTLPRRETIAIQQLLMQHYPLMADVFPPRPAARRRSPQAFRRTVYRHNLWARPLPDFTGRFRDCTPEFYRYNDSQMHRLVPWLNRELHYLLNENIGHISYVLTRILELLPRFHINSPEFREAMQRYFGERTDHFLHELYCFASTPYDMTGYDRNVQYTTDSRISTMVNEVISSSDSEASVDSDIVMVSSSHATEAPAAAGPSRPPPPVYPHHYIPPSAPQLPPTPPPPPPPRVITIETLSHSDSDDDDEVMVVGYIKPPQDRTPEVVDLLGSDSDVIVQDPEPAAAEARPAPVPSPAAAAAAASLVKLSLKRHRARPTGAASDSDDSYRLAPPRRRKRVRSANTATTSDTARTTPSPSPALASDSNSYTPSPSPEPSSSDSLLFSDSSTTSSTSYERRKRLTKKKLKRKEKRKRSTRSRRRRSSSKGDSQEQRRSKRKSHSGKGVKSSKRSAEVATAGDAQRSQTPPLPVNLQPGPSEISGRLYDTKRLKSVVNVMYRNSGDSSPGTSTLVNTPSNHASGTIACLDKPKKTECVTPPLLDVNELGAASDLSDTDSDDNLPLNLSIQKTLS